ncbi:cobaltochelatase subunit CobN [Azospirillum rugosum]|uniref:Cobaltochelatase CobN n=1 Tax=Azospirillum rugosum TaxID=416170 RepID=A0ABS4SGD7_9PROT|nr:cobaltochelatase subunit CobN [Azospirillum rugosum]MBP2291624.1 cobaltochelatase CobN [Azospirillum rugosum]MDQ0524564.1 cobaltochelatase CobN [Azospirillum rugosum]
MHLLAARQEDLDAGPQAVDLGQTPAELVVLSFSDSDLTALAAAHKRNRDRLPSLRLANLARLGHPLSVDLYVDSVIRKAKFVMVRLLGGAGYWRYGLDHVAAACRESGVALAVLPGCAQPNPSLDGYGTIPKDSAQRLWRYFTEGGPDNMVHLLAFAATLAGRETPWREPAPVPRFGVYEGWSGAAQGPVAPVVFYRSHLLASDLEPVHALCDALADRGLSPLPLFVASLKEPDCAAWMRATLTARNAAVVMNLTGFSAAREDGSPLEANGTPVLQAILSTTPEDGWRASSRGLGPSDLAMNVVLPEMDGRILTRAIAFKAEGETDPALEFAPTLIRPVPDRVAFAADLARAWVRLAATPRAERRLALVLSDYPGPGGGIGHAVGLDTPASVVAIMDRLRNEGYAVDAIPDAGASLMAALTGESTVSLGLDDYRHLAPPDARARIAATWGAEEADPLAVDGAFRFRVLTCGNAVVAVQPSRGHGPLTTQQHHDPETPPSHGYLAFHLWFRHAFGIHALVQVGAHGTLEWLPGKAVALSAGCWPEIVAGPLPCLYPFIVNNPGEGVQARRRLGAVLIGHLTPPPVEAGLHGDLAALEQAIDEYSQATGLDPRRLGTLRETILDLAWTSGLAADCNLNPDDDPDTILNRLDAQLCDIKELQIRDGLHVFGTTPEPERRARLLAAVARSGDPKEAAGRLDACGEAEMTALLAGLDGRFVKPGPGGSPARGRADTLPTGRNLYALDPRGVPTPTAWTLGWQAADALITRYLQDHGDWPKRLVVDCWGTPTMRTGGDELAQAMALLGVRPLWENGSGRVIGFEVMPASVLGRPRVDVTLRISGLFRDVFPQQIALFDQAVRAVIAEDEPDDVNPVAAAARADRAALEAGGTPSGTAERWAAARVFGSAPGVYGTALSGMIARGDWTSRADFGAAYLEGSCHAYGKDLDGLPLPALFRRRVGEADALVHHQDQREHDVLSTDGFMQYEGGFSAAAALADNDPALYHLDSSEPEAPTVRTLAEEITRVLRGRAANPRWIAGMMRHGYRGAAELAASVDTLYAFAATTAAVRSHHFDQLFDAYIEDQSVWDFLAQSNPAAAGHILDRLTDAMDRGLWHPRRNSTGEDLRRRKETVA